MVDRREQLWTRMQDILVRLLDKKAQQTIQKFCVLLLTSSGQVCILRVYFWPVSLVRSVLRRVWFRALVWQDEVALT